MSESKYLWPWQEMDSAPKDGTKILLFSSDEIEDGFWYKGTWGPMNGCWTDGENRSDTRVLHPVAWMPLPEPPKLRAEIKEKHDELVQMLSHTQPCACQDCDKLRQKLRAENDVPKFNPDRPGLLPTNQDEPKTYFESRPECSRCGTAKGWNLCAACAAYLGT